MSSPADAVTLSIDAPMDVLCLACDSARCDFSVQRMQRRALRPDDIAIDIKFCGVCHSDLHQVGVQVEST